MTNSTREKLEEFSHYLYVVYRERQNILNSNTFRNVNINLLIFENFILTFHNEPIHNLVSVRCYFNYYLLSVYFYNSFF